MLIFTCKLWNRFVVFSSFSEVSKENVHFAQRNSNLAHECRVQVDAVASVLHALAFGQELFFYGGWGQLWEQRGLVTNAV